MVVYGRWHLPRGVCKQRPSGMLAIPPSVWGWQEICIGGGGWKRVQVLTPEHGRVHGGLLMAYPALHHARR
eukprot:359051-Pelagomonas_calceolata.AAC.1